MSDYRIIRSKDIVRAALEEDPAERLKRHPYGEGEFAMQVRMLGLMGFDVAVGMELMPIDDGTPSE